MSAKGRIHRAWWPMALSWAIGLMFLVFVLTKVDFSVSWHQIQGLVPRRLLWPLIISLVGLPLRPWRWSMMFPPERRPSFPRAFAAFYIGNMANNVLPARGGDLLRCFLLNNGRSLAGASCVMGTLAVEKVIDGLTLLGIVAFFLPFLPHGTWVVRLTLLSAVFLGSVLLLLLLLLRRPDFINGIVRRLFTRRLRIVADKLDQLIANLAEGLTALRSTRRCAMLLALTAAVWFLEAAFIMTLAQAVLVHISLVASVLVIAIIGLGLMIPAAPGSVGTYEYFAVAALGLFGVNIETALALTVILHAWVFLLMMSLGIGALAAIGLPFSALGRRYKAIGDHHQEILPVEREGKRAT